MSQDLVIVGCGARTPLGFDLPSSAAAVHAGISAIAAHPFLFDRFGDPMRVARDMGMDPRLTGIERLSSLAVPAAREALAPLAGGLLMPRVSIVLCVGEQRPGQKTDMGVALTDALCGALPSAMHIGQRLQWMGGHAGGILALETARRLLAEGDTDLVLAGGVDSYLAQDTLEWLDDNEQLHSDGNIYGFSPGEAAGFLLLTTTETARRLHLTPRLSLVAVGSGIEKNLIKTEDICLGEGLAAAMLAAAEPLSGAAHDALRIDRVICDMNGERYRGNEYGFAILRARGMFKDPAAFEAPADCWGDVGAASGPLYIGLVAQAHERGHDRGPLSLVWASSEGGRRAAAIVNRWGGA